MLALNRLFGPALGRSRIRLLAALVLLLLLGSRFLCGTARADGPCLMVGTEEWPPYEYSAPDGHVTGLSTEIITTVLSRMGVAVGNLSSYPWARCLKLMEGHQLDLLYSSVYDPSRLRFGNYPKTPLFKTEWILFVRKADAGRLVFRSLSDLDGHGVGVVRGYSYSHEFNEYIRKGRNVVAVSDNKAALELLTHERVDYVVCERHNGLWLVNRLGLDNMIVPLKAPPLGVISLYALFNRQTVTAGLVHRFDRELARFKKDQGYWDIVNHYLR